jgi:membrane fusion protein, multidrug efflux system
LTATELRKSGAIAQEALDDSRRAYDVAAAGLEAAQAYRGTAEQEVSVQLATVAEAKAALARAKYDLDRTVIVAPVSGRVAPLIVRVGDYLVAGRPVVAIISDQNWRLVVNLPERHLQGLKVGQGFFATSVLILGIFIRVRYEVLLRALPDRSILLAFYPMWI